MSALLTIAAIAAERLLRLWRKEARIVYAVAMPSIAQSLVSHDAGPAVVGFRSPIVVIPEWVLGFEIPK